jgi:hypothetical protein
MSLRQLAARIRQAGLRWAGVRNTMTLGTILRRSLDGSLPYGWVYLPEREPWTPKTRCVLLSNEELEAPDDAIVAKTAAAGFPVEGLDSDIIESIVRGTLVFTQSPSDELLVEAFTHYYHHDAYLPFPGAPSPPHLTMQEFTQQQDRAFYDTLGDERPGAPCGEPGCDRGAILFSTRCRRHHFENVKGRPCIYE